MSNYVLEMTDINKAFSGVKVLEDVNFALQEGHVHALVGGNGAGKSTLMKILTGVYTHDSGTVSLFGKPVKFSGYSEASKNGVRMIYQELSLIPTLSVAENIFLNQEEKKARVFLDKKTMIRRVEELLKDFGIDIDPRAIVKSLGVGLCQLVEIAKALSQDAKILVMDEPTASLSENEVNILFKLINNLKSKNVSIIYISHRMNEILRIADEVTVLRDGKKVMTLPAKELDIESIIRYMLGEGAKKSFEWEEKKVVYESEMLLETKNLHVNNWVTDISIHLNKGEVLGFAGLMGSGRTEILQALFGLAKIKGGEVFIEGKKVEIHSVSDAIKAGIALVPEDRRWQGLILSHTIRQNVSLPILKSLRTGILLNNRKIKIAVSESVRKLNIKTDSIDKLLRLLSGGNQQKVVVAKWLRTNPKILLLDEPTAGIDIGAKGEIIQIIRDFVSTGNAAVLVSSELSELMAVCDRILILHKGKITAEHTRKDITSEEVIQHAIQN